MRVLGAFKAIRLEAGQPLCLEGERGESAWLIADGHVEILVATAGPGCLLAAASHFLGGLRLESLVPVTDGWAYALDRTALRLLEPEARACWNELASTSLREQSHVLAQLLSIRDGDSVPTDGPRSSTPTRRPADARVAA